ncbi:MULTISPECIES: DNA-directed RNA polymerase subunit omega [unclassified Kocuria]|uniref:DNA-directed RNA polymerase subunit omega n=1 Tax=Kocuria subflava TaxID=1736139 RepID=A0A846TPI3_9MICC|nr:MULTISPECIES: DNA-directed RNA polymerase subunit omega [unclassified Kocuria]NKE08729.1 DNA-directed RNA polymerase subunit omega [Kocuria subflava]
MSIQNQGIIEPPVDRLLAKSDSKYGLVIFAARRARQINAYYSQLHEGLFEYVGPLVDVDLNEKSLSVSLREIDEGLINSTAVETAGFSENGQLVAESTIGATDFYGEDFFGSEAELDSSMVFSDTPLVAEDAETVSDDDGAELASEELAPESVAAEEQADVSAEDL